MAQLVGVHASVLESFASKLQDRASFAAVDSARGAAESAGTPHALRVLFAVLSCGLAVLTGVFVCLLGKLGRCALCNIALIRPKLSNYPSQALRSSDSAGLRRENAG